MDRGAWRAIVHVVTKSQTKLSAWVHMRSHTHTQSNIAIKHFPTHPLHTHTHTHTHTHFTTLLEAYL